ncbi:response regulator [Telmatocola sphagniphila]|nr:response regulator [Telmatocola sphagniphila]
MSIISIDNRDEVFAMTATLPQRDLHILITDDDPNMRAMLREIVEAVGAFKTHLAANGNEACEIAQSETVHLALLDYQMPQLTGMETLQLLRQMQEVLPAILITADATLELVRKAMNAQFYSVIPKPFSKNVVTTTVVRALIRFYGDNVVENPKNGEPPASKPAEPAATTPDKPLQ